MYHLANVKYAVLLQRKLQLQQKYLQLQQQQQQQQQQPQQQQPQQQQLQQHNKKLISNICSVISTMSH